MTSNDVELKDCYGQIGVVLPLGGSVFICVLLALGLYHFWRKFKATKSPKHTRSPDREVLFDEPNTEQINQLEIEVNHYKQEMEELQRTNETLRTKLYEAEKEKRKVLNRLSEQMSTNLRDGNPNIADLSDENRPTNVKDMLSELYDNEYTDALTTLETDYKLTINEEDFEREASAVLLNILKCAFDVCTRAAKKQLSVMDQVLIVPKATLRIDTLTGSGNEHPQATLPKEYLKKVKDLRKSLMPEMSNLVSDTETEFGIKYCESSLANYLQAHSLKRYLKSCVQITWLMAIQDPPMYPNFQETDRDHLRIFTKSGLEIDYMVWPSLFLEQGGTFMAKGIAQFKEMSQ